MILDPLLATSFRQVRYDSKQMEFVDEVLKSGNEISVGIKLTPSDGFFG